MNTLGKIVFNKTQNNFKNLYNEDRDKAMYTLRQVLSGLNFYSKDDSLINFKINQNRLYVLSFCPEISFDVPQFFMYDDIKSKRASMPTLFTRTKLLLDITSSIVTISQDMLETNALEIPFRLVCYELKQNLMFGEYKDYHNLFVADKKSGNYIIPDELESLVLKSTLVSQIAIVDINKSNISEYRRKISLAWARNEISFKENFFIDKSTIFEAEISNLIKVAEENLSTKKAS